MRSHRRGLNIILLMITAILFVSIYHITVYSNSERDLSADLDVKDDFVLPQITPEPLPVIVANSENVKGQKTPKANAPRMQLCFIVDSSGSIYNDDWQSILDGIASSIDGIDAAGVYHPDLILIPHDESIEINLVVFSSTAYVYDFGGNPNFVLAENNYNQCANMIRTIPQLYGGTNMADGFIKAFNVMSTSPYSASFSTRAVNLSTDGGWNTGGDPTNYRTQLINELLKYGAFVEVDAEAVGVGTDPDWMATHLTYPETCNSNPCQNVFTIKDTITCEGFVLMVGSYSDFYMAFKKKLNFILPPKTPTPSPTPELGKWVLFETSPRPPVRYESSVVFDELRQEVVLFGGYGGSNEERLSDTWNFNFETWVKIGEANDPNTHPIMSGSNCFVYDSLRDVMVYFGGYGNSNYSNQTWEYMLNYWFEISTTQKPTARSNAAMVYDSDRNKVILFGGIGWDPNVPSAKVMFNDTWEYDGYDWEKINTTNAPSKRESHAMVYDPILKKTLLFGGKSDDSDPNIWQYDGTNWSIFMKSNTSNTPKVRYGHSMAYCKEYNGILMYGGMNGDYIYDETWLLRNNTWMNMQPSITPQSEIKGSMVWNTKDKRFYYFGGKSLKGEYSNQIWYYIDNRFFAGTGYRVF